MVVLITGAGLLGRHVAARLADRGDDVVVIDQKPVPAGVLPPGASAIQGDINDIEYISRQITRLGVTDVVHTAAMLAVSASDNPPRAVRTNLLSAVELLELARQGAIRRLILASSGSINYSVFGRADGSPIPEDFEARVLSEGPSSIYIATKLSMEYFCQIYTRNFGVSAAALRFGAILGATNKDDPGLISKLALSVVSAARARETLVLSDQRLLWEGKEEFLDPRDAAAAVAAALAAPSLRQPVYNIASNDVVTVEEFLQHACSAFPGLKATLPVKPVAGLLNFPHLRRSATDISAATSDLGFTAKHTVRDALTYLNDYLAAE